LQQQARLLGILSFSCSCFPREDHKCTNADTERHDRREWEEVADLISNEEQTSLLPLDSQADGTSSHRFRLSECT
jgi:hypothetical protein